MEIHDAVRGMETRDARMRDAGLPGKLKNGGRLKGYEGARVT